MPCMRRSNRESSPAPHAGKLIQITAIMDNAIYNNDYQGDWAADVAQVKIADNRDFEERFNPRLEPRLVHVHSRV